VIIRPEGSRGRGQGGDSGRVMLFCQTEFLVAVLESRFPGESVMGECNVEVQVG
jgi:hypothetical protein